MRDSYDMPLTVPAKRAYHPEVERLIGNAVCDPHFATALIHDPLCALHGAGYALRLSTDERGAVVSVQGARSITEFAAILYERLCGTP